MCVPASVLLQYHTGVQIFSENQNAQKNEPQINNIGGKTINEFIERREYEKDMRCASRNEHIVSFLTEVHIQSQLFKGQKATQMPIKLNGS